MRQLTLFLLLVALCTLGSMAKPAGADDPPAPKPAEPAPPPDPKKPPGSPPAEPPKPGEPKPEEPKPGEPPVPPAPEDPEVAKKKAEEEEKKRLEEEAKEREADEAARKKKEGEQAPVDEEEPRAAVPAAPRQGPPGMVYLPPAKAPPPAPAKTPQDDKAGNASEPPTELGEAVIGTKNEDLARLLGNRPPEIRKLFDFERPQHRRPVRECWYDACEVTNAQYWEFLKDHSTSYVCDGKLPTLVDVAGQLLGTAADKIKDDDVAWRQLAEANKDAILAALPDLAKDWPASAKHAILPKRDLILVFYKRRPPEHWSGMVPPEAHMNHPVRDVSGLDAEAFAEWSGKHLQTEFEYEWAARGPDAPEFPWGKIWHNSADYCNWGAKIQDPKTHEADTWEVGSHPRGRSWVGAMDTVGNVAEWTASPFWMYPGFTPKGESEALGMLGAVYIIRGGTAVDQEQLVLRPAARNFVGTGFNSAPPYPSNRYAWVGFRCAWWFQPGANQAPAIERRVTRGGRIKAPVVDRYGEETTPGDLDLARTAGSVAENWGLGDAQNGVWVRGRAKSVVLIPRRWLVDAERKSEGKDEENLNFARSRSKEGLLKESESKEPIILLGAFHTDVKLPKVWVRKRLTPEERAALAKEKKRGREEAPPMVEGACAPGTYVLALWHKRLCLVDGSREFVCGLTPPDKVASVDVKKVAEGKLPECKVQVDDTVGLLNGTLTLPLATGKSADPLQWVLVSFSLEASAEDLQVENGWR